MNVREIGVSTSAFGYSMGATGRNTERKNPNPWTLEEFVDFAITLGLGGVEAPMMRFVPDLNAGRLKAIKEKLQSKSMFFVMDAEGALDVEEIKKLIPVAKEFGSPIIRIKTSNILSCARKKLGEPWRNHIERCISVLKELTPLLREHGLKIALENHQDVDSNDLLQIVDSVGEDVVGVTFDIGNAFSVCEDPLMFVKKLGSRIINIHIKDYQIYKSVEGYRLVRCPIGVGAVDFPTVLPLLALNCPSAKMVIELGALEARNIAFLEPGFWEEIQPRTEGEKQAFAEMQEGELISQSEESWKTPWESGANAAEITTYESEQLRESLKYLSTI